jgi:hypothetical protein
MFENNAIKLSFRFHLLLNELNYVYTLRLFFSFFCQQNADVKPLEILFQCKVQSR